MQRKEEIIEKRTGRQTDTQTEQYHTHDRTDRQTKDRQANMPDKQKDKRIITQIDRQSDR